MGLIRSCAPLFAPPPPSLFLVSTLLSAPLARARPLLLHKINEKKTSFDRSFSLRFLLSTRFYSISFPKPLKIFLKFLATVCWYKLLVHLPVLIVRILKKFSKFALAISHPSRNASKATSVAIVLRAIVFLFFFFFSSDHCCFCSGSIALFLRCQVRSGTWHGGYEILNGKGRLFRSNKPDKL